MEWETQDYTRAHFARRTVFDPFSRRGGGVAGVASGVEIPENPVLPEEARAARGTKGGVRGFRIWNGHSRMGRRRAGPRGSAGAELPPVQRRAAGSWLRVAAKIGRLGGERRRRGRALRAQKRTRIYTLHNRWGAPRRVPGRGMDAVLAPVLAPPGGAVLKMGRKSRGLKAVGYLLQGAQGGSRTDPGISFRSGARGGRPKSGPS